MGHFLVRLEGRFIHSLTLMVMKPDALVELGCQTYTKEARHWRREAIGKSGRKKCSTVRASAKLYRWP